MTKLVLRCFSVLVNSPENNGSSVRGTVSRVDCKLLVPDMLIFLFEIEKHRVSVPTGGLDHHNSFDGAIVLESAGIKENRGVA